MATCDVDEIWRRSAVVFKLCECTVRQTDRHTHHNTWHPSRGRSNHRSLSISGPSKRNVAIALPKQEAFGKNVGPIRHCEPPHALILHCHLPGVATVARRLRIDVHDNDDNNDNA